MTTEAERYERLAREAEAQEMRGSLAAMPASYYWRKAREAHA